MSDDEPLVRALAQAGALGFLGPGPTIAAHVTHAEAFLQLLPSGAGRAVDLGSGGGIPGLVLAWRRSDWTWLLVDASRRRTSFLVATVATLGLADRVAVLRARAEDLGHDPRHRASYDVVTARSFAPPAVTAEVGGAFLRVGGALLVADPPDQPTRWNPEMLASFGLEDAGGLVEPALRRLVRVTPLASAYPRPNVFKRPLA